MEALLFAPAAVAIALTPGPNNFCGLNNGIRAGVAAALLYGVLARTPADRATSSEGIDLADPEPSGQPDVSPELTSRQSLSA